jgi:hypothetical protein
MAIATSRQQPHAFAWDTRSWANGIHRLTARVTDGDGNWSVSGEIEVTVANAPDDTPPRLRVRVSRSRSRALQGRLTVRVWAADESPVRRITLFLDGSPVATKDASSLRTLRFVWDTRDGNDGVHLLSAGAADAAGNYGASMPLEVRVENRGTGR